MAGIINLSSILNLVLAFAEGVLFFALFYSEVFDAVSDRYLTRLVIAVGYIVREG